MELKIN